jgi:starch phosphorylase
VSRRLFLPLYPRWPEKEIPVGHVTNGVHVPSWDSPEADDLWTKACGPDRWLDGIAGLGDKIRRLDDRELWQFRNTSRHKLVMMAREHVTRQGPVAGSLDSLGRDVSCLCDPDILTLGFARRFTEYKRCNLLLHDMARAEDILCADGRKVQLVMAGKAHPADAQGKAMIRQWTDFISRCNIRPHVVFLVDYDMAIAEHLVHGVDVWLNTPRRPWEASGTSGMKVLANGGLNLSELDGWWAEAYAPEVGWAIGDGKEHDPSWDAAEAAQLYDLLENQVIPEFYDRDGEGIPRRWVARIRESMARLAPMFSTSRMVNDYVDGFYLPASAAYMRRCANGAAEAEDIVRWRKALDEQWQNVGFVDYQATHEAAPGGDEYSFRAQVRLGALPPSAVRVELYADPLAGSDTALAADGQTAQSGRSGVPEVHRLSLASPSIGESGPKPDFYRYETSFPATRPVEDYTPRVVGGHPAALVPLEATHICWLK